MVLDLLLIGIVVTLEPIPVTAFILVLSADKGVRKGAAFILGWFFSLAVMVAITLAATGNNPPKSNTAPSEAVLWAKVAIGVVLLITAERSRRRIGKPRPPKKPPRWQARLDQMSLWFAAALGLFVQPWVLVGAGIATIAGAKLSTAASYFVVVLFCLLASSSFIAMEVYTGLRPERSRSILTGLKTWIDRNTDLVIVILSLGLGLWLIGKSTYLLVT